MEIIDKRASVQVQSVSFLAFSISGKVEEMCGVVEGSSCKNSTAILISFRQLTRCPLAVEPADMVFHRRAPFTAERAVWA